MNAGIVLVLAGVWVGAQVLGGGVLERLGILGSSSSSSSSGGGIVQGTPPNSGPGGLIDPNSGRLVPAPSGPGNQSPALIPPAIFGTGQSYPAPNVVPQPTSTGMI